MSGGVSEGIQVMTVDIFGVWTDLILHRFHPDLHFAIEREISLKQSMRNIILTTLLWRFCCFSMCPQVVLLDESDIALFGFEIAIPLN